MDTIVRDAMTNTLSRVQEETIAQYEAIIRDNIECPKRRGALTEGERIRAAAVDIYYHIQKHPQPVLSAWSDYVKARNEYTEAQRG